MSLPDVSPELPSATWRAILTLLGRLPQGAMSRTFGQVADIPIPGPMRRAVLGLFARSVGIDVAEAELPLERYGSLNEFFVRRLRDGVRAWPDGERVIASPVDGIVGQGGQVRDGRILQAKGRWYSIEDLTGEADDVVRYQGGSFLTLYLSPRHYHRIHAPCPGTIPSARHIPGGLLPVNAAAVLHIPDLFARNERVICYLDAVFGRVAVVAVGAYNVGRISTAFDPAWSGRGPASPDERQGVNWVTNRRRPGNVEHRYDPPVPVATGEEIMAFHLGSTVVLLTERGSPPLRADLAPGMPIRLGEPLSATPAR